MNSGCTIVRKVVADLRAGGNNSVYGIVDWDGSAASTDGVRVVAEEKRDGIENILLDPVLVCLLLMKLRKSPTSLDDIDRFTGAEALVDADLQRLADAVQTVLFPEGGGKGVVVTYLGGKSVSVFTDYLKLDDHKLEGKLVEAFPSLNKWATKGRGALVEAVVEEVLTEYRNFCPLELKEIFENVANN